MKLSESGSYCIYLRKSRSDREAEQHGEGETLARHEKILLDLSKRLHISIGAIYREVVSGETISARPVMQQLLHEVEQGLWDGVLVVEVERLARGDTIDQGTVSRAFQFSDTKIITPTKTYDPNNEFDEEYFEFGLFMSRREYKTIKRRLNAGRISSVNEGKYVGNKPPYGYLREKLPHEKGFTLTPHPDQAPIVRMIYDWYVNGMDGEQLGVAKITRKLNSLGIPAATKDTWSPATVKGILENPVYIGKVRWNARKSVKKIVDGKIVTQRPRSADYILKAGLHPALIPESLYQQAQIIRSKNPPRPVNSLNVVKNPLAGLVYCSCCNRSMVRRPYTKKGQPDSLICPYTDCSTVSSRLDLVEQSVICGLQDIVKNYKLNDTLAGTGEAYEGISEKEAILSAKKKEVDTLSLQKTRLYDLLEQGIYSTDIFLQRSEELRKKMEACSSSISSLEQELEHDRVLLQKRTNFIPHCEYILEHYWDWDVKTRNDVLKDLIEKVVYTKTTKNPYKKGDDITFTLDIYPRIIEK